MIIISGNFPWLFRWNLMVLSALIDVCNWICTLQKLLMNLTFKHFLWFSQDIALPLDVDRTRVDGDGNRQRVHRGIARAWNPAWTKRILAKNLETFSRQNSGKIQGTSAGSERGLKMYLNQNVCQIPRYYCNLHIEDWFFVLIQQQNGEIYN